MNRGCLHVEQDKNVLDMTTFISPEAKLPNQETRLYFNFQQVSRLAQKVLCK